MAERFEFIEHTADIALRAFGRDRREVYESAALGLLEAMVARKTVRAEDEETIEVEGADPVDLLVAWLHEVLYRFDTGHVFASVTVNTVSDRRLTATLLGEPFDPERHEVINEIKAVTYHGARVEEEEDAWVAEVVFDA